MASDQDQTFKVGEAPWERADVPSGSFKVGEAPWEKSEQTTSPAVSAVRQFAQGASGNMSDELAGILEGAGRAAGFEGVGGPMKDIKRSAGGATLNVETLKKAYQLGRDHERASLQKDMKDNPGVSTTANLVGAVTSPINKIAKGASALKGGAAIGAINAFGSSDADNVKDLAKDTAIGAGVGGTIGKAVDVAAPVVAAPVVEAAATKVGSKAADLADRFAARALGAERGTIKKMGMATIQKVGRYARENGLITPGASTDDMIATNEATKKTAMDARKAAYNKIDEAGASAFDPSEVVEKIKQKVLGGKNPDYEDTKELVAALDPHLKNILSRGDGTISMSEAQDLVESLGKKAKFDTSRSTLQNQVATDVYHTARQAINEAADEGAQKIGAQGVRETIEAANDKYSSGKGAQALLKNKQAREQGNRYGSLTDWIAGAGAIGYGEKTGDWKTASAVMLAKKGLERYGSQNAANLMGKVAKGLLTPQEIEKVGPESVAAIQSLLKRSTESGTLPAAADNQPTKGPDKWANDGFDKLIEHAKDDETKAMLQKARTDLMNSPKMKEVLIRASDLKPGSVAMEKLLSQLKEKK
jgi:hypothetical protein